MWKGDNCQVRAVKAENEGEVFNHSRWHKHPFIPAKDTSPGGSSEAREWQCDSICTHAVHTCMASAISAMWCHPSWCQQGICTEAEVRQWCWPAKKPLFPYSSAHVSKRSWEIHFPPQNLPGFLHCWLVHPSEISRVSRGFVCAYP